MKRVLSKQSFFNRLMLHLSLYFTNEECSISILSDYEEWFANETVNGKNEKEICAALEEPKTIAKKLFIESGSSSSRFFIILHNPILWAAALTTGHLLVLSLLLSIFVDKYYYFHHIYRICGIMMVNILYFIIGSKIIKKSDNTIKPHNFIKKNVLLFFFIILFIPLVYFLAYLPKNPAFYGAAYVNTFGVILFVGYIANICFAIYKILQEKQFTQVTFCMLLHISGIISVMAFLISQHNFLYSGWSEFFISNAYGTFLIYAETFVFCLLCLKKHTRSK